MDFVVGLYVAWNAASWQSRSTTTGQDATCSKGRGGTGIQLPLLLRNKWYPVLHSCANICFSGSAAEKCQTCHLILIDKVGSQMCPNLGSWNWVSSWQTCRYVFLGDLVIQRPGCGDWIATIWWMVAILFPMGCKRTQVLSCHQCYSVMKAFLFDTLLANENSGSLLHGQNRSSALEVFEDFVSTERFCFRRHNVLEHFRVFVNRAGCHVKWRKGWTGLKSRISWTFLIHQSDKDYDIMYYSGAQSHFNQWDRLGVIGLG